MSWRFAATLGLTLVAGAAAQSVPGREPFAFQWVGVSNSDFAGAPGTWLAVRKSSFEIADGPRLLAVRGAAPPVTTSLRVRRPSFIAAGLSRWLGVPTTDEVSLHRTTHTVTTRDGGREILYVVAGVGQRKEVDANTYTVRFEPVCPNGVETSYAVEIAAEVVRRRAEVEAESR